MKRDAEQALTFWKDSPGRLPLLLRGARQVGKSYTIERWGKEHFDNVVVINFELQPELIICFESLEPTEILQALAPFLRQKIEPGKTLLFLDEIQECPNAIRALRYFKEKLPELHVIGAGSLLEFTLNDAQFRMPVGRVQFMYMKPLSFKEYLSALGYDELRKFVESTTSDTKINISLHEKLLQLVKQYIVLGGMPAVVDLYLKSNDLYQCQLLQSSLLNTYRLDFGKYASKTDHKYLQRIFEKIPQLIGLHVKYSKIDPEVSSREIKKALGMLKDAGLISPIYSTNASGLPLSSSISEKKFKLLFVDMGLVSRMSQLESVLLFHEELLLQNRGFIIEQFVGQELLAAFPSFEEANLIFGIAKKIQHSRSRFCDDSRGYYRTD